MVTLIDGKKTAQDIKNEIAARVAEIKQEGGKYLKYKIRYLELRK